MLLSTGRILNVNMHSLLVEYCFESNSIPPFLFSTHWRVTACHGFLLHPKSYEWHFTIQFELLLYQLLFWSLSRASPLWAHTLVLKKKQRFTVIVRFNTINKLTIFILKTFLFILVHRLRFTRKREGLSSGKRRPPGSWSLFEMQWHIYRLLQPVLPATVLMPSNAELCEPCRSKNYYLAEMKFQKETHAGHCKFHNNLHPTTSNWRVAPLYVRCWEPQIHMKPLP